MRISIVIRILDLPEEILARYPTVDELADAICRAMWEADIPTLAPDGKQDWTHILHESVIIDIDMAWMNPLATAFTRLGFGKILTSEGDLL